MKRRATKRPSLRDIGCCHANPSIRARRVDGRHDQVRQLQTPSLSTGDYRPRGLAVFPVSPELAGHRCSNLKRQNETRRSDPLGCKTEELINETDFACHMRFSLDAVAAADHAHGFKTG